LQLNKEQQEAVNHIDGPMMVVAGPGSGKTAVITERVKHLVKSGISPENILVITFTRAAALEMKKRYFDSGEGDVKVKFGTFHSVFFTMLRAAYNFTYDNIVTTKTQYELIKEIDARSGFEVRDENEFADAMLGEISHVKGSMVDIDLYYSMNCPANIFKKIYASYDRELKRRRLLDFDDMMVYTYELLTKRPDILKAWQNTFRYILIDEFQDVNSLQFQIVKMLAEPAGNLFIVGDDDQSIYGFRGSRPDIMRRFTTDYPEAEVVKLSVNYRCSGNITETAGRVISHNKNRISKKIRAQKKAGDKVSIRVFENAREENAEIRKIIKAKHDEGLPYSEISVIYRTNVAARGLISALSSSGIPYRCRDQVPNLYEHWIAQDILAYIRVASGSLKRKDFLRIVNRPNRYISRNVFTEPEVDLIKVHALLSDKDWINERLTQLEYDLDMIARMKPFGAMNFIRRGIGYDDYIKEYADYRGMKPDDMYLILDELTSEAHDYNDYASWFDHIERYSDELLKQAAERKKEKESSEKDAVVIQTMHSSKGMEYHTVFIPDANEGVTPHSKAVLEKDMEEERRMFYVAMTRAESSLYIYYLKERMNKDVDVSRFVMEAQGVSRDRAGRKL
jgi:DNA helicase-2/ATP-dependent DNA helicase PcrA